MSTYSRCSSLTPCRSPTPEPPIMQPDHFYGSEGITFPPSPRSDGKAWLDPNDDPHASRGIPVFKPTMEQFRDFEAYMEQVNCWGQRSGIVKVIPPKEWSESLPSIKPQLKHVQIKSPIEQHMLGNGGLFRQQNVEKRKKMSVREWVELCNQEGFRAPAVHEVGLEGRNREPRPAVPRVRKAKKKEETIVDPEDEIKQEPLDTKVSSVPSPPTSTGHGTPPAESIAGPSGTSKKTTSWSKSKEAPQKSRRVPQSREARQANLEERAARDEEFVDAFDPENDWLPHNTIASDYDVDFCQKLERHYWRNCGMLSKSPWYGADTQGTLYTDETTVWNVGKLHSALDRLLPASSKGLPGVNTPYLYFGMWRATFAWHVEDMDLYSINYIHFGAPKFWYAVPQSKAIALEHAMRTYFPQDTSQCHQFLRHKSFLVSPTTLAKSSCRPNTLVQHAGEFVITYPRGYHAGFNLGLNCAESVNFALDCWIEMGRNAKICKCVSDSVRIDVDQLLRDREAEAQEAEAQEDQVEPEPDVPPPKPKRSHKKKVPLVEEPISKAVTKDRTVPPLKISPKKRKLEGKEEVPQLKKIKLKPSLQKKAVTVGFATPSSSSLLTPSSSSTSVSKPVMLKIPRLSEAQPYPCCLCVSMDKGGLLPVQEPPLNRKDAVDAANNPKVWMAHELCARIIPETWVDEVEGPDGQKSKMVFGVNAIVKDRWNLKCSACTRARPKGHGAPVQCTKGKCPKAFHVMCAVNGEESGTMFSVVKEVEKEVVIIEPSRAPPDYATMVMDIDGVPCMQPHPPLVESRVFKVIKKLEVQILCSQHNPAIAAQKKAQKMEKIKQDLQALPPDSRVRIRVTSGVFEVSLIRVIEENCSVEVWWDNYTKREFKWGSLVFGNTDGPVLQKGLHATGFTPMAMVEPTHGGVVASTSVPVPIYPSITAATAETSTVTNLGGPGVAPTSSLPSTTSTSAATPPVTSPPQIAPQTYVYAQQPPQLHQPSSTQVSYSDYYQYAAQQMPYGYAQTYPYPYSAYYSGATPYSGGAGYNMYAYPAHVQVAGFPPSTQAQYRNGGLQWQRPYQGPAVGDPVESGSGSTPLASSSTLASTATSTTDNQDVRPSPPSTQSQTLTSGASPGTGGGNDNANIEPDATVTTNGSGADRASPIEAASTTQSGSQPPTQTDLRGQGSSTTSQGIGGSRPISNEDPAPAGSSSHGRSTQASSSRANSSATSATAAQSAAVPPSMASLLPVADISSQTNAQIGPGDLAALAQLPHNQLIEILSNNPSLRGVILSALNLGSVASSAGSATYSLG